MSRYDWGQRHPGIDRLEEQIGEARRTVIEHPVYASLDSVQAKARAFPNALGGEKRLKDVGLHVVGNSRTIVRNDKSYPVCIDGMDEKD